MMKFITSTINVTFNSEQRFNVSRHYNCNSMFQLIDWIQFKVKDFSLDTISCRHVFLFVRTFNMHFIEKYLQSINQLKHLIRIIIPTDIESLLGIECYIDCGGGLNCILFYRTQSKNWEWNECEVIRSKCIWNEKTP